jgi:hypothetical protein
VGERCSECAREAICDGERREFGAAGRGGCALNVHLRQQRPAKSLYFHTPDLALRSR